MKLFRRSSRVREMPRKGIIKLILASSESGLEKRFENFIRKEMKLFLELLYANCFSFIMNF